MGESKKEVADVEVGEKIVVAIFEGTIVVTIFGVAIDATIEGIQCRTATKGSITKEVQE